MEPQRALDNGIDPLSFTYPNDIFLVFPAGDNAYLSLSLDGVEASEGEVAIYPLRFDEETREVALLEEITTGRGYPYSTSMGTDVYSTIENALLSHKMICLFSENHPSRFGLIPKDTSNGLLASQPLLQMVTNLNTHYLPLFRVLNKQMPTAWIDATVGWFSPQVDPNEMGSMYIQSLILSLKSDELYGSSLHPLYYDSSHFGWILQKMGIRYKVSLQRTNGNKVLASESEGMLHLIKRILAYSSSASRVESALTLEGTAMGAMTKSYILKTTLLKVREEFTDPSTWLKPVATPREINNILLRCSLHHSSSGMNGSGSVLTHELDSYSSLGATVKPLLAAIEVSFSNQVSLEKKNEFIAELSRVAKAQKLGEVVVEQKNFTSIFITRNPQVLIDNPLIFNMTEDVLLEKYVSEEV